MHNTTCSFIYVHRNGTDYSYCNNLDTQWPLKEWAWKSFKSQLKPCYAYAILNESYLAQSKSGHSYKPVCILMELDSLEEAKAVNQAYYTGYRKIHEENLSHLEKRNALLQDFVDKFSEQLVAYSDFRKTEREELSDRIKDTFTDFKDLDYFFSDEFNTDQVKFTDVFDDLDDEFDDEDENLLHFFNL